MITQGMLQPTASLPPPDVIERIRSRLGQVKMLPDVAVRALEIAGDPESRIQEFSEVIQQDVKLATGVLSIANSVLYSAGRPIASLDAAIARIGFRQCKNLVISSCLSSVIEQMSIEEEWVREVLWKHSLITGVAAAHLNRIFRAGFDGEEFTAGLVHDFGRIMLAVSFPDEFASFDPLDFDESTDLLTRENEITQTNHCDLGAWFASDQGLPDILHDVIRLHHSPELATPAHLPLVALTATADHMANHYARFGELDEYTPSENPGPKLLEQSGIQDAVNRFNLVSAHVLNDAVADVAELASFH